MSGRSGRFWDAVEGRAPLPPQPGLRDTEAFTTPMGTTWEGFLAAMLYDSNIRMLPVPAQFCVYCCLTSAIKPCRVPRFRGPGTMRSPIKRGSAQAPATGAGG